MTRTFTDFGGQVPFVDHYVSLNGNPLTHTGDGIVAGATYHRWNYGYDKRGRRDRVLRPTDTIERTLYDGLGRVVSTSVGTDDEGADATMTKVREFVYDSYTGASADMADSKLTQVTEFPDGSPANNRVTHHFYDWRNRRVATRQGAGGNGDSVQRPFFYTEFNNWNLPTIQEQYDGDTITSAPLPDGPPADGVPDKPDAGLLRAKTVTSYDDQRRVFRTETFSVNPDEHTPPY